jgi:hypothetical protein
VTEVDKYRLIARALRTHAERCRLGARSRGNAGRGLTDYRMRLRNEAVNADALAAQLESADGPRAHALGAALDMFTLTAGVTR